MSDKSNFTKKKLCDTFIELYSIKDLNKITIHDITSKAGYNRGTFYLYYKDIYDMLEKIEKSLIDKLMPNINIIITDKGLDLNELFINTMFKFYKENEKYVIPLMIKDAKFSNSIKENLKNLIFNNINFVNSEYKEKAKYLIEYQSSAIVGIITLWYKEGKQIPLSALAQNIYSISKLGVINSFKNINQ